MRTPSLKHFEPPYMVVLFACALGGLYIVSTYNYILFHTLVELGSIIIAAGIFLVAWHSRERMDNGFFTLLGVAYLSVAFLDILHTVSYKGMGVFPGRDADLPTQLWIATRYLESISLLIAPIFLTRRIRVLPALALYGLALLLLLLSIVKWKIFPNCYLENHGLTSFKIVSEYVIALILCGAGFFLYLKRAFFEDRILHLLLWAIFFTILSELSFTLYVNVYGTSNLLGHFAKLISFFLVYRALVITGFVQPQEILFKDLEQKSKALQRREALLKTTSRVAKIGGWEMDPQTGEITWTKGTYQIYEMPAGQKPSMEQAIENFHPQDRPVLLRAFADARERGVPYDLELRFTTTKGKRLWTRSICKPVMEGGRVVKLEGAFQDITERRLAQQNLEISERRFRQLFDAMISGFALHEIILDENGHPCDYRFLEVNPAFERLTGHKAQDVVGRTLSEVMPDTELQWIETYGRVATSGESIIFENFSQSLGKHYEVVAYSPAPGQFATIFYDVTKRKQAEKAQREAILRQSEIVKAGNVGLWDWDLISNKVHFSTEWKRQIGYEDHEISDDFEEWRSRVHPDDLEPTLAIVQQSIDESRQGHRAEFRFRHKDGSYRWMLTPASVISDENGRPIRMLGAHVDITERKRAEEMQLQSLELLQSTLDSLSSHMAILDDTGTIIAVNLAWRTFGKDNGLDTPDLGIGSNYLAICESAKGSLAEEAPLVAKAIGETLRGDREQFYLEYPCHSPGEQRWFALRMTKFAMDNQVRLVMAHENITHRRLAEEALRQSEEKFRLSFDTSPDAININRLEDGLFVEINHGFTEVTGFTKEDVLGKTSMEISIWADPQDRQTLVEGLREKGYYENLEAKFRRKDGSLTTALMSARLIMLAGVPHILSITRDISERIKAEEDKARLGEQLRQAQKMEAVGTLAGGIAHDFNNILAAIMGNAEIALLDAENATVAPGELKGILSAAERAKALVQQILTFSRRAKYEVKPVDINEAVLDAGGLLKQILPKMIEIRSDLSRELDPVMGDRYQVEQILMNLGTNSRDAMPDGGTINIRTSQETVDNLQCLACMKPFSGEYVVITVRDTGAGMDAEDLGRIFEPFYTTKEVGKGTGLGLSTVFGIVKSFGGHLTCQSKPGKGTTFGIYLPPAKEAGNQPEKKVSGAIAGGIETILLVDDAYSADDAHLIRAKTPSGSRARRPLHRSEATLVF
ncbi:MAG: PAS domain S-box protein [Desulfarculaceae bacterium]|nr:PAS domain S-box protein [Desulfarculaceae bacterium]